MHLSHKGDKCKLGCQLGRITMLRGSKVLRTKVEQEEIREKKARLPAHTAFEGRQASQHAAFDGLTLFSSSFARRDLILLFSFRLKTWVT